MTAMKIEQELLKLTGEKAQGKNEKRETFLKRMVKAAEAVEEKLFDTLPGPAQDWANAGIRADDKGKAIEDFPDVNDADESTNAKEAPVAEAKTAAKPAKTAAKPAAASATKPAKAAAPAKEAKKRGNGKVESVLGVILSNPSKKAADLVEILKAKDIEVTPSTVSTVRSDFIRAVNFLDGKKLLTKNPFA